MVVQQLILEINSNLETKIKVIVPRLVLEVFVLRSTDIPLRVTVYFTFLFCHKIHIKTDGGINQKLSLGSIITLQ